MEVIDAAGRASLIDEAAEIWAEATATRDQRDELPGLEDSRPVIQRVLARSARSFLLIARSEDGTAAGFAAIEPAPGRNDSTAVVAYLGVTPRMWGQGVGGTLLSEVRRRAEAEGYACIELSVYVNNQRATKLYLRAGWEAVGQPTPHSRTGKPEQRYTLRLQPASR